MSNAKPLVSIVKGDIQESPVDYTEKDLNTVKEMVLKSLELIGGVDKVIGKAKNIIIKPNLVEVPFSTTGGSVLTDPRVLEAVVLICKEQGAERVLVGEGKSVNLKHVKSGPVETFKKTGLTEVVERAGGEIIGWDVEPFVTVDVPGGQLLDKINVPQSILDADLFINIPKMKTHGQTEITCAMKSMQGVYSVEDKVNYHNEAFPWKMVDMLRVAKPHLNIVDALISGEDFGPIYTTPVDMNLVVSSVDCVATDAVCSSLMGINPDEVPITRLGHAEGIGVGVLEEIEVKGEAIEDVRKYFKRSSIWNPIGYNKYVKIFAGGACRFCLAQVAATVKRLDLDHKLEKLDEEVCIIIGHNAPKPVKEHKNVYIIGDCARDCGMEGDFIAGCPPLPSVQIAEKILKIIEG